MAVLRPGRTAARGKADAAAQAPQAEQRTRSRSRLHRPLLGAGLSHRRAAGPTPPSPPSACGAERNIAGKQRQEPVRQKAACAAWPPRGQQRRLHRLLRALLTLASRAPALAAPHHQAPFLRHPTGSVHGASGRLLVGDHLHVWATWLLLIPSNLPPHPYLAGCLAVPRPVLIPMVLLFLADRGLSGLLQHHGHPCGDGAGGLVAGLGLLARFPWPHAAHSSCGRHAGGQPAPGLVINDGGLCFLWERPITTGFAVIAW